MQDIPKDGMKLKDEMDELDPDVRLHIKEEDKK